MFLLNNVEYTATHWTFFILAGKVIAGLNLTATENQKTKMIWRISWLNFSDRCSEQNPWANRPRPTHAFCSLQTRTVPAFFFFFHQWERDNLGISRLWGSICTDRAQPVNSISLPWIIWFKAHFVWMFLKPCPCQRQLRSRMDVGSVACFTCSTSYFFFAK
jgi:hypothetical protein